MTKQNVTKAIQFAFSNYSLFYFLLNALSVIYGICSAHYRT